MPNNLWIEYAQIAPVKRIKNASPGVLVTLLKLWDGEPLNRDDEACLKLLKHDGLVEEVVLFTTKQTMLSEEGKEVMQVQGNTIRNFLTWV